MSSTKDTDTNGISYSGVGGGGSTSIDKIGALANIRTSYHSYAITNIYRYPITNIGYGGGGSGGGLFTNTTRSPNNYCKFIIPSHFGIGGGGVNGGIR
jgi:hypothetical protein